MKRYLSIILALLFAVPAYGQGLRIRDLDAITAAEITDDTTILFGTDRPTGTTANKLSLAELRKKTDVRAVANVAAFASVTADEGQIFITRGYSTAGIGSGIYRYHATGRPTADGVLYFDAAGADDYLELLHNGVIDVTQAGALNDGSADIYQALTRAMTAGDVYFPAGEYLISTEINLRPNRRYFGDGARSVIKKDASGDARSFVLATYDYENGDDEATFKWHVENVEIDHLGFDFNFSGGWREFAPMIQFRGSSAGSARIEDVKIHDCWFFDSAETAHDGSGDSWCINYSAVAPTQRRLAVYSNHVTSSDHQFIAGGAGSWTDVDIYDNFVWRPRENGISYSSNSEDVTASRIRIRDNFIVDPEAVGVFVGMDGSANARNFTFSDVLIEGNVIVYQDFHGASFADGILVRGGDIGSSRITVRGNKVYRDTGSSVDVTAINIKGCEVIATTTTAASYTQPTAGANVAVTMTADRSYAAGTKLLIGSGSSNGGIYTVVSNVGAVYTLTFSGDVPRVNPGNTVPSGLTVTVVSPLTAVEVVGNTCTRDIKLLRCDSSIVRGNSVDTTIRVDNSRDVLLDDNSAQAIRVVGNYNGVISDNKFSATGFNWGSYTGKGHLKFEYTTDEVGRAATIAGTLTGNVSRGSHAVWEAIDASGSGTFSLKVLSDNFRDNTVREIADGGSTPSVRGLSTLLLTNSAPEDVTNLTGGYTGQSLEVHVDGNTTLDDSGGNFKFDSSIGGTFNGGSGGKVITLRLIDGVWTQTGYNVDF